MQSNGRERPMSSDQAADQSSNRPSLEEMKLVLYQKAQSHPGLKTSKFILEAALGRKDAHPSEDETDVRIIYSTEHIHSWQQLCKLRYLEKTIFIVTTVFEDLSFFAETLTSVVNQEPASCDIVYLIKDASQSEDCLFFVLKFFRGIERPPCNLTVAYLRKPDSGMYEGLGTAFQLIKDMSPAASSLMTYINADDYLMPWSSRIADSLLTQSGAHWVTGSAKVITESGETIFSHKVLFEPISIASGLNLGRVLPFIQQEGTFWTFSLYARSKGINKMLKLAGDFDLWRQFANIEPLITVDESLGAFRKRSGQKSENIQSYYKEVNQLLSAIKGLGNVLPLTADIGYDRRPIKGLLASLKRHNSIGYYSRNDDGSTVPIFEERHDPLYGYPIGITQIEGRYRKQALIVSSSVDADQDRSHGIDFLGLKPNSSDYYFFYRLPLGKCLRLTLRPQDCKSCFTILRIRVAALTCETLSFLRLNINGRERELVLDPVSSRFPRFDSFIDYVLLEYCHDVLNIEASHEGCIDTFISFHLYCTPLPQSFGSYSFLKESFYGWPYLAANNIEFLPCILNELPLISIIVPTRNQASTLRDTLASIRNQFYPKTQVVLLDGYSSDDTRGVLADFLDCIDETLIIADEGQADAIAKGISLAQGEIVTWLNSDDLYAPFCLYRIALAYRRRKTDVLVGDCMVFRADEYRFVHSPQIWNDHISLEDLLDIEGKWLKGKYFHQPECFFTRSAIDKVASVTGEPFINRNLYYSMDYDIWAKMALAECTFQRINAILSIYRLSDEQKTSTVDKYLPELLSHSRGLANQFRMESPRPAAEDKSCKQSFASVNILLFNDNGFFGGAGIAHKRIAKSLLLYGINVQCLAYSDCPSEQGHPIEIESLEARIAEFSPDLVICGNIHGLACDHLALLKILSSNQPCWFLVHDFWITSGIHPYPSLDPGNPLGDAASSNQEWVAGINRLKGVHLLPNSRYTHQALAKVGFCNLINPRGFTLGFEEQGSILSSLLYSTPRKTIWPLKILIGSAGLSEFRNGGHLIIEALKCLSSQVRDLIHISSYGPTAMNSISNDCSYTHLGLIDQPAMFDLMLTHDVYVSMSGIETFGQSSVEALRAGLSLIVVDNGGSDDYAINDYNAVVIPNSSNQLSDAITRLVLARLGYDRSLQFNSPSALSLDVDRFSLASQGYSLLKLMHSRLDWQLPVGGQRVACEEPADADIDLHLLSGPS